MKWYSTPESLIAGEISILAILETVAATIISVIIAYHFSSLKYIAISACIAPWLLLRSEKSTIVNINLAKKKIDIFEKYYDKIIDYGKGRSLYINLLTMPIALLFLSAMLIIIATITRIFSIIITLIRNPIYSIKNIPANWNKVVLSTDIFSPPQIFPGIEFSEPGSDDVKDLTITWRDIVFSIMEERIIIKAIIYTIIFILCLFPITLTSYIYRWSIKSTSLIWSPLIWILRTPSTGDLIYRLNQINEAAIYKVIRYYSALVI
ncbi:MAG: hypothetical protein ACYDEQ_12645, partial [Desulfocucumaceae bacterium]